MLNSEIAEIVSNLNCEIQDGFCQIESDCEIWQNWHDGFCITMVTDGWMTRIEIGDFVIWDSENDERDYTDDDECEYEPLEGFLRRQIPKYANILNQAGNVLNGL